MPDRRGEKKRQGILSPAERGARLPEIGGGLCDQPGPWQRWSAGDGKIIPRQQRFPMHFAEKKCTFYALHDEKEYAFYFKYLRVTGMHAESGRRQHVGRKFPNFGKGRTIGPFPPAGENRKGRDFKSLPSMGRALVSG